MDASHNTTEAFHAIGIGNHRHSFAHRVSFVIQCFKCFSSGRTMDAQGITGHFVRIKHMEGPVVVKGEKVGHIHKCRNRTEPDGLEPVLQPPRTWTVLHAFDYATIKHRTLIAGILINADAHGTRKVPLDRVNLFFFQHPNPAGCQITRDAADTQSIGTVWRYGNFNHSIDFGRVMGGQPICKPLADLARGQFNDPVVLIRQFHFPFRTHHAKAFDASNFANAYGRINPRHIGARFGNDHRDSCPRVGSAAYDLRGAFVRLHLTNAQLVRIGMFFGPCHFANRKITKPFCGITYLFNLKTKVSQGV